jgi:hypothetical protein
MPAIFNTLAYYAILPNFYVKEWEKNPNQFVMQDEEFLSGTSSDGFRTCVQDLLLLFVQLNNGDLYDDSNDFNAEGQKSGVGEEMIKGGDQAIFLITFLTEKYLLPGNQSNCQLNQMIKKSIQKLQSNKDAQINLPLPEYIALVKSCEYTGPIQIDSWKKKEMALFMLGTQMSEICEFTQYHKSKGKQDTFQIGSIIDMILKQAQTYQNQYLYGRHLWALE